MGGRFMDVNFGEFAQNSARTWLRWLARLTVVVTNKRYQQVPGSTPGVRMLLPWLQLVKLSPVLSGSRCNLPITNACCPQTAA